MTHSTGQLQIYHDRINSIIVNTSLPSVTHQGYTTPERNRKQRRNSLVLWLHTINEVFGDSCPPLGSWTVLRCRDGDQPGRLRIWWSMHVYLIIGKSTDQAGLPVQLLRCLWFQLGQVWRNSEDEERKIMNDWNKVKTNKIRILELWVAGFRTWRLETIFFRFCPLFSQHWSHSITFLYYLKHPLSFYYSLHNLCGL